MSTFPSKFEKDAEGSTGLVFMRTYNKWHGEIKRQLKTIGITHPQFVILTTIGYMSLQEIEITQTMVASMAGMDVMSVSQILVLLERKGWVKRRQHSKDTRANAISLTDTGHEKMAAALPIVEKIDTQFFGYLEENEGDFKAYLQRLNDYPFLI